MHWVYSVAEVKFLHECGVRLPCSRITVLCNVIIIAERVWKLLLSLGSLLQCNLGLKVGLRLGFVVKFSPRWGMSRRNRPIFSLVSIYNQSLGILFQRDTSYTFLFDTP